LHWLTDSVGSNSINIEVKFPVQVMNTIQRPKIHELKSFFLPMPKGRDEVKTAMDSVVYNVAPV